MQTIKNIKTNPHVSLAVWNKEWEKACAGFEIIGQAVNHTSGVWLEYVKNLPDNEGCDIKSVIVIEVQKIKQLRS